MKYTFVSYSSKDAEIATAFREIFSQRDIPVWMAPDSILPGQSYLEAINKAIRGCSCVVFLLSRNSLKSKWVAKELERAVNYNKTIVRVDLENARLNDTFEMLVSDCQAIPLYDMANDKETLENIINSVASYLKITTPKKGKSAPDKVTKQTSSSKESAKVTPTSSAPARQSAPQAKKKDEPDFSKGRAFVKVPHDKYVPPVLSAPSPSTESESSKEDHDSKSAAIVSALGMFGIGCEVVGVEEGASYSLYKLAVTMPKGKSVATLANLEKDLAMYLGAQTVRLIIPIPGTTSVGIEVPNKNKHALHLGVFLNSPDFSSSSNLDLLIGVDATGKAHLENLNDIPNMIIGGVTGSGKSVFANSILVNLMCKASPDQVRFILIDPKRVEFSAYNGLPHLLFGEVICDLDKSVNALRWVVAEMDKRYSILAKYHAHTIDEYNSLAISAWQGKMPHIVVVVDELSDLMVTRQKEVEDNVAHITRLSRAVGIHLILSTQRPSVNVITGTIKSNVATRVAFKTISPIDSRVLIDQMGAERLEGNGDMLFMSPKTRSPLRLQGAFIQMEEVKKIVDFVKLHNTNYAFDSSFNEMAAPTLQDNEKPKLTPELLDALKLFVEDGIVSVSYLQRKRGIGYNKAAKFVDILQDLKLVDGPDLAHLKVSIAKEDFEALLLYHSEDN